MFEQILGNKENKLVLESLIKTDKISHSYIFTGEPRYWQNAICKRICKSNSV